ncbi:MAG: response regulator [Alphaproteobacteria bacterium]|nr:response regulator [Alphaproteobacteria bacterium]
MSTELRSKLILAVDDSPEDLALLNAIVMGAGYTFVGAASGEDALSLVHRCTPRLILLDIQMPGLDGIETCRRLRENSQLKTVPIAFLTARKTRGDVKEGLAAGGNDFIAKPIHRDTLLQRVQHWTNHRVAAPEAA